MSLFPKFNNSITPFKPNNVLKREMVILFFIFFAFVLILFQGINEKWLQGHQGFNGAIRSTIARNYNRYGFIKTHFLPIKNLGPVKNFKNAKIHWHHPPLINILVAISFRIFGESESSARFVPIFFTILSFFLIYFIVRNRYGPSVALLSVFLFSFFPMTIEYGKMVNYEPVVIGFTLLGLWFLENLRENKNSLINYFLSILFLMAACFTDWPGFIFTALIGIDSIIRKPRKFTYFFILGILSVFLLIFLWFWLNSHSSHDGLLGLAKYRGGSGNLNFTYKQLFFRTIYRFRDYYGSVIGFIALLGIIYHLTKKFEIDPIISVFSIGTLIYFIFFKSAAFIHIFFLHYISPAIAVGASLFIFYFSKYLIKYLTTIEIKFTPLLKRFFFLKFYPGKNHILAILILLSIGVWFKNEIKIANKAKLISYGIRKKYLYSRTHLPQSGRLDVVLLAELIHKITKPSDLILIHPSTKSSPQFRYYLGRTENRRFLLHNISRMNFGKGKALIIPQRVMPLRLQRKMVNRFPVIKTMRYLIFNLSLNRRSIKCLDFYTHPANWSWSYLNSIFYPPFVLRNNRKKVKEYIKLLNL